MLWHKTIGAGGAGGAGGGITVSPEGEWAEGAFGSTNTTVTGSISLGAAPSSGFRRYIVVSIGGGASVSSGDIPINSITSGSLDSLTSAVATSTGGSFEQNSEIWYYEDNTSTADTFTVVSGTSSFFGRASIGIQAYAIYCPDTLSLSVSDTDSSITSSTSSISATVSTSDVLIACGDVRNGESDPANTSLTGPTGFSRESALDTSAGEENFVSGYAVDIGGTVTLSDTASTQQKCIVAAAFNFT